MKLITTILLLLPFTLFAAPTNYSCKYSSYSNDKGNNGSSEVIAFSSKDRISFVEVTATKNIMSTAIDSKLNSVHSRNSVIAGKLVPSQYYGKCKIK